MAESRPLRAAAIIGALAEILFLFNLTRPAKVYFDETHYVHAARLLLSLSQPFNTEHPLFGKTLIAASIWMFGDNPFGWRFLSTLAGTAVVLGVFWILWMLFRSTRTAVLGAIFTALNFTVFMQARIAMLDGFMAAFVVLGVAALLWSAQAPAGKAWRRWLLGAVLLGLAMGTKWAAIPYLAFAGIAFLTVRVRDARAEGFPIHYALRGEGQRHWTGMAAIPAGLALVAVSVLVYLATFAPAFFYARDAMTFSHLLPFQVEMYAEQTQVLPHHPYQSDWWTWPWMKRPIWYLYEPVDGIWRGVLMLGNPAILWGGMIAVLACAWAGWRERSLKYLGVAALWGASYGMFALIPKSPSFFYYYYPASIFLCVALAAACHRYAVGRWKSWDEGYVALCAGLFVYFYPIISAAALSDGGAFHRWMWFSTWP